MSSSIAKSWLYSACKRRGPAATTSINSGRVSRSVVGLREGGGGGGGRGGSSRRPYTTTPHSDNRPFRMAVIGSGPAGFYTAYRVMSKIPGAKVDMFEALPVPFGLVRFGVAPDHPEVKNCQEKFEEVASSPDFTFLGNVAVGGNRDGHFATEHACDVPLGSLLRHYDAVVFAYGASRDRRLGVPGEDDLRGIYSAREFVGWYNGLPEFAGLEPDLAGAEEAVIVGQGNVALDVARILLTNVDVLRRTDITDAALETLSKSRVKRVHVVGRRGPMQAAFTIKELRELMKLPGVGFHPIDKSLIPSDLSQLPRARRRMTEVMVKGSTTTTTTIGPDDPAARASWSLDFCLAPTAFLGDAATGAARVRAGVFERVVLTDPFDPGSAIAARTTPSGGETVEIPAQLVFRSVGYKSVALPGFADLGLGFDDARGVLRHDGRGRVVGDAAPSTTTTTAAAANPTTPIPGVYCAGWVKRGPAGVIAQTMEDAFATADTIAGDWGSGGAAALLQQGATTGGAAAGWEGLRTELDAGAECKVVTWDGWRKIDAAERERGRAVGKEREKFTSTSEMLAVL